MKKIITAGVVMLLAGLSSRARAGECESHGIIAAEKRVYRIGQLVNEALLRKGCDYAGTEGDITTCSPEVQAIFNEDIDGGRPHPFDQYRDGLISCKEAVRLSGEISSSGLRAIRRLNRLK